MGSAVGQVPDYACMITEWVKEVATIPVMVKLTPNVGDVRHRPRGGRERRGRRALADQHDQLDHGRRPRHARPRSRPSAAIGSHGGYCGPAVKPIALNMVGRSRADPDDQGPDQRHRRHPGLAGRRRVPAARRRPRAGLHGRHALRLPDRRALDRAASRAGCARRASRTIGDFVGQRRAARARLGRARPELQGRRRDSTRTSASTAASATSPARTAPPVHRAGGAEDDGRVPRRSWTRLNASAATSARWSAPWTAASP